MHGAGDGTVDWELAVKVMSECLRPPGLYISLTAHCCLTFVFSALLVEYSSSFLVCDDGLRS